MDRLLASPVSRGALIDRAAAYQALTTVRPDARSSSASASLAGARFHGGVAGRAGDAAGVRGAARGRVRRAVQRGRAADPAAGGADRDLAVPVAAADVPVVGIMAARADAGWVQTWRAFNPVDWAAVAARAGARPRTTGLARRLAGTGAGRASPLLAWLADPGVPHLPALGLRVWA